MVIYAEFLDSRNTRIDQSESMLLATSEAEFGQASVVDAGTSGAIASAVAARKVHLSIDQVVVRRWSNQVFVWEVGPDDTFENSQVAFVVVVVDCDRAKIDVVWVVHRAMYHLTRDVKFEFPYLMGR